MNVETIHGRSFGPGHPRSTAVSEIQKEAPPTDLTMEIGLGVPLPGRPYVLHDKATHTEGVSPALSYFKRMLPPTRRRTLPIEG